MKDFVLINSSTIEEALSESTRQYLVGDLKESQKMDFVKTAELEVGISNYPRGKVEPAHTHTVCNEYQYMLSGYTEYLNVDTGVVHCFKKGDFYFIPSGVKYVQRAKENTRILFIKVPSKNDKVLLPDSPEILKFISEKIESRRVDYFHDDNAPKANSIRPATAVALVKNGKVLMIRRKDNDKWSLPGGTLEYDETMDECAIREMKEETGLDVFDLRFFKLYNDPKTVVQYLDGEVRREFTAVYIASFKESDVLLDSESKDFCWVEVDKLLDLTMADSQRVRIKDLTEYLKNDKD